MTSIRIAIDSSDAVRGAQAAQEALRRVGAAAKSAEADLRHISDVQLELGNLKLGLGPDPLGIRAAVASAEQALSQLEDAKRRAQFGAGVFEQPFGDGIFGGGVERITSDVARATAATADLGVIISGIGPEAQASFGAAQASVESLANATIGAAERTRDLFSLRPPPTPSDLSGATSLGGGGATIDPRGLALIEAQDRALDGVRAGFSTAGSAATQYGRTVTNALPTNAIGAHVRSILSIGAAFAGIRGVHEAVSGLIEFQDQVLEINQSTGLSGAALQALTDRILALSTSIPVATNDLLALAAAAGRLQIKTPEGIEQFVRDAGNLRASIPGLGGSIDEFASKVGQILTTLGESPADVGKLGDAIARLDDQFQVSGDDILTTAGQVARASGGMLQGSADAIAFGAALASMGAEGRQAAGAVANGLTTIRTALAEGGKALTALESITGKTRAQLQEAFRTDAAQAFVDVLDSLGRLNLDAQTQALIDLGLASAQDARQVGPLIENTDNLRRALTQARDAQEKGGDAAAETADRLGNLSGQLAVTSNLFRDAAVSSAGLSAGLTQTVGFTNEVIASMLGMEVQGHRASAAATAVAGGLEGAAVAAGALMAVRVATGFYEWFKAAQLAEIGVTGLAGSLAGLTAAEGAASAAGAGALVANPYLAVAAAVGLATTAVVGLYNALDNDAPVTQAAAHLGQLTETLDTLDRAAASLKEARDIQFRAEISGDAAEKMGDLGGVADANKTRIRGLEEELRALDSALDFVAGDLRAGQLTIPTPKIEALGLTELGPELEAAGSDLGQRVGEAMRKAAESEWESLAADPTGFAAMADPAAIGAQFVNSFSQAVGEKFGPEVQAKFNDGVKSLDLRAIGLALTNGPEIPTGEIDKVKDSLKGAGGAAVTTQSVFDALTNHINGTNAALEVAREQAKTAIPLPPTRLSDFYVQETERIRAEIQSAQLAIKSFNRGEQLDQGGGHITAPVTPTLTGIEAEEAAVRADAEAYARLIAQKKLAGEIDTRGGDEESQSLLRQSEAAQKARIAVIEYTEAQRRLGAEQDALSRGSSLLGQQIQLLGERAQGDTAQAFELMREQIELATMAELKNIRAAEQSGGVPEDEIAKRREFARATHETAMAGVEYQEWLVKNRRAIEELGQASDSFASHATDALLGVEDPLKALRGMLLDLARDFIQPRLKAGFLDLFPANEELKRATAQQGGVQDLVHLGPGPALPEAPSPFLGAQALPDFQPLTAAAAAAVPPLEQLGAQASAAGGGLQGIGPAAEAATAGANHLGTGAESAAGSSEHLATAAELAANALDEFVARMAAPSVSAIAPIEDAAKATAGASLDLPAAPAPRAPAPASSAASTAAPRIPGANLALPVSATRPPALAIGASQAAAQQATSAASSLALPTRRSDGSAIAGAAQRAPVGQIPQIPGGPSTRAPSLDTAARAPAALQRLPKAAEDAAAGLDSLDSGAQDAARAVAALPKAEQPILDLGREAAPVGPALGEIAGPSRAAAPALSSLAPATKAAAAAAQSSVLPIKLLGASAQEQATATQVVAGRMFQIQTQAAAGALGGAVQIGTNLPTDIGTKGLSAVLAPAAGAQAASTIEAAGQEAATQAASAGLAEVASASPLAASGLTQAQVAALEVVTGFHAANAAAAEFAVRVAAAAAAAQGSGVSAVATTAAVAGSASGNVFPLALGAAVAAPRSSPIWTAPQAFEDGTVIPYAQGGSPYLDQIVSSPTLAPASSLAGAAIVPLSGGGVEDQRGRKHPMERDSTGELVVKMARGEAQPIALAQGADVTALFGEAGPEAVQRVYRAPGGGPGIKAEDGTILPLERHGGGRLGVRVNAGGSEARPHALGAVTSRVTISDKRDSSVTEFALGGLHLDHLTAGGQSSSSAPSTGSPAVTFYAAGGIPADGDSAPGANVLPLALGGVLPLAHGGSFERSTFERHDTSATRELERSSVFQRSTVHALALGGYSTDTGRIPGGSQAELPLALGGFLGTSTQVPSYSAGGLPVVANSPVALDGSNPSAIPSGLTPFALGGVPGLSRSLSTSIMPLELGGVPGAVRTVETSAVPFSAGGVPDLHRSITTRVQPFAAGGVPNVGRLALIGAGADAQPHVARFASGGFVPPEQRLAQRAPSVVNEGDDHSRSVVFNSNVYIDGKQRSPLDSGMKLTMRQFRDQVAATGKMGR